MSSFTSQEREWIDSYLNGTISPEAFESLQERMMESPALRKTMRRYLNLDYQLQEEGGSDLDEATPARVGLLDPEPVESTGNGIWPYKLWAVAASIAVLAAVWALSSRDSNAEGATISAIHGPVQWTNNQGQTLDQLQPGTTLEGGLLESLLPESWIELAFQDNSRLTLSGHATLMIAAGERKRLHLRNGNLSAQVSPQPKHQAMVLHTPTAELSVLGTQFDVDAQQDATRLIVNEGRIQLKRLADGSSTEVRGGHQVVAAINDPRELEAVPRGKAKEGWRSDLAAEVTYGNWSTDVGKLAIGQLKKLVASGEITTEEGIARYQEMLRIAAKKGRLRADAKSTRRGKGAKAIVVLSLSKGSDSPVIVPEEARFRIRGHLQASAVVEFGFTTYHPGGRFAGKFATQRSLEEEGEEGFELEIGLSAFESSHQESEQRVTGMEIRDWWCATGDHEAQLEITHMELLAPSRQQPIDSL